MELQENLRFLLLVLQPDFLHPLCQIRQVFVIILPSADAHFRMLINQQIRSFLLDHIVIPNPIELAHHPDKINLLGFLPNIFEQLVTIFPIGLVPKDFIMERLVQSQRPFFIVDGLEAHEVDHGGVEELVHLEVLVDLGEVVLVAEADGHDEVAVSRNEFPRNDALEGEEDVHGLSDEGQEVARRVVGPFPVSDGQVELEVVSPENYFTLYFVFFHDFFF